MNREAIVLAGGLGSRLKTVVSDRPKPMAEINGKPFLEYLLRYLNTQKITRVIFSVGHKHEMISNYFENSFLGMEICYAIEYEPLGTGGGIQNALREAKEERTFILNGDTFFPVNMSSMIQLADNENTDLLIALHQTNEKNRYGTIHIGEKGRILKFEEKSATQKSDFINGGIYLLKAADFLKLGFPEKFSFEKDYLEKYVEFQRFFGILFNDYFIDIGIPDTYLKAQKELFNQFSF
jgi:D-glycero-alpha-D-manno-heptose 1-phosphate guanylyltransferase